MAEKITNGRADNGFPPMMLPLGLEALMELNRPALSVMAEVNGRVYENLVTLNKSWVAFVNRRLKEDLAMPKQLAECRTVQDMYSVYADFFQTAMTDYQSGFEHMSKLGKSIAEETAQAVQTRLEEGARAVQPHS
jgi:Phasin protein